MNHSDFYFEECKSYYDAGGKNTGCNGNNNGTWKTFFNDGMAYETFENNLKELYTRLSEK